MENNGIEKKFILKIGNLIRIILGSFLKHLRKNNTLFWIFSYCKWKRKLRKTFQKKASYNEYNRNEKNNIKIGNLIRIMYGSFLKHLRRNNN